MSMLVIGHYETRVHSVRTVLRYDMVSYEYLSFGRAEMEFEKV